MKPDLPADPERWRRIEALLDEMFERPAGERRAFLDEACAGNPELRAQMEALLTADEEAGGFLATPAHRAAAELLADISGEAAPLADRELGPYRLVREIGSGGMGVVYEAEDTRLRRRVAVKLLPPALSRDRGAKQRFLREARAASALDDPNICTVDDIGEHDGQLYIVMADYEGGTLKERLAKEPLPESEARKVAIEVVSETDDCEDVFGKTRHYFQAGVRAVWLVYPSLELMDRVEILLVLGRLQAERIEIGMEVPARAVGADQHQGADRIECGLLNFRAGKLDARGLRPRPDLGIQNLARVLPLTGEGG